MAVTTTKAGTLQTELDKANPNTLGDALAQIRLGTILTPLKVSVTGMNATSAVNLTLLAVASGGAVTLSSVGSTGGAPLAALPPVLQCLALRVTGTTGTTGTASPGPRVITDAAGTAAGGVSPQNIGVALISDDGTTLTFDGAVSGFIIEYMPRANAPMSTSYPVAN